MMSNMYVKGEINSETWTYVYIGATVQVACKEAVSGAVTVKKEGVTDASGKYRVEVEGDHQDEVCEVSLLKSSDPNCSEVDQSIYVNQTAIVSLTRKDGVVSPLRTVNPLGFFKTQILPQCLSILGELKQHMSNDL